MAPAIWGDDMDEFRHMRFLKTPGGKHHNPITFCGFCSGTTLCLSRHFAMTKILLFVTLLMASAM
ncbi:hypothetical protein HD806DRAFT_532977 [Xylariaceae sp. AK1471]|nr:hypothetical protein HD806DRAFT_532977 [Xylariaceae sp. AK1471]